MEERRHTACVVGLRGMWPVAYASACLREEEVEEEEEEEEEYMLGSHMVGEEKMYMQHVHYTLPNSLIAGYVTSHHVTSYHVMSHHPSRC